MLLGIFISFVLSGLGTSLFSHDPYSPCSYLKKGLSRSCVQMSYQSDYYYYYYLRSFFSSFFLSFLFSFVLFLLGLLYLLSFPPFFLLSLLFHPCFFSFVLIFFLVFPSTLIPPQFPHSAIFRCFKLIRRIQGLFPVFYSIKNGGIFVYGRYTNSV